MTPIHLRRSLALLSLALAVGACPGGGDSPAAFAGEIEFRGTQPMLPGFDFDSGFLPADSPGAVRATASAGGGITAVMRATTDGTSLMPVAGSGSLAIEGAINFEVSARIDVPGAMFEGLVESFEYTIAPAETAFEPFALGTGVVAESTLPAAELGSVPIPGLPGATLVVEATGGTITTTYTGTCADTADGLGQVAGTLSTEGTLALGASIVIDIPFVFTDTFGPFPIDVPIPAIASPLDLGTRSLATGEPADSMGICDGTGGTAGTEPSTATDASTATMTGDTDASDTLADTTDPTNATDMTATDPTATTDTGVGDTTTGEPADPSYPNPDSGCPSGSLGVGIGDDPPNGVCAPPCDAGSCPAPATGSATGECIYNPDSSFLECADDSVCMPTGEACVDGTCQLPPTHCILLCDDTVTCPDGMTCVLGACSYLQ